MAYTTPTTRSTNDIITAAQWNADLTENVKFLANPPMCRVYNSGNISTNNTTFTAMTFDSESFDTDNMHSTGSNTSRITFPTAGVYVVGASITFANNGTGLRGLMIGKNTTGTGSFNWNVHGLAYTSMPNIGGADAQGVTVNTIQKFSAGEWVEFFAYQSSTAALNVIRVIAQSPEAWAAWQSF